MRGKPFSRRSSFRGIKFEPGVVVVEAAPRIGSLSTAHHATEQDREVFAVPGPVDSLASRGCHRQIRDGARLVETVDDILEKLGPLIGEVPVRHAAELALSDQECSLLCHLDDRATGVDEPIVRVGLIASLVLSSCCVLELQRMRTAKRTNFTPVARVRILNQG
jgi:DNA processing protein